MAPAAALASAVAWLLLGGCEARKGAFDNAGQQCDTAGMMAASIRVQMMCCPNGDGCAGGAPPSCAGGCAEQFLPFMDTYNHGACAPMLQMMGANLHLGDLEASCREEVGTDGGEDASAVDCSPAVGMPIALACSEETRLAMSGQVNAAFCESPCAAQLVPYYEECASMMPVYMTYASAHPPSAAPSGCPDDAVADRQMMAPLIGQVENCGERSQVCELPRWVFDRVAAHRKQRRGSCVRLWRAGDGLRD